MRNGTVLECFEKRDHGFLDGIREVRLQGLRQVDTHTIARLTHDIDVLLALEKRPQV